MGKTISILVPAYNAAPYIGECLNSILGQRFTDFEVVILDDGSTDDTGRIADEFAQRDARVRVYHQENQGIVPARSRLMRLAEGDYVGWVDADDRIRPEMYGTLYETAVGQNADVVICDYEFFPDRQRTKGKWFKPYRGTVDWRFMERNGQHWNKLVRRSLLEKTNMAAWNEYCGEGSYALAMIFADRIATVSEPLYCYRVGHASLSSNLKSVDWYLTNIGKAYRFRDVIHRLKLDDAWGEYYDEGICYAMIQAMIVAAHSRDNLHYAEVRARFAAEKNLRNRYLKTVLDDDYGKLRSFVIRRIIPSSYTAARLVTGVGLR